MFALRQGKKIIVLVLAITAFIIGVALVFLPGPAFLFFFFGLLLLSTEFVVAKKILKRVERMMKKKERKD